MAGQSTPCICAVVEVVALQPPGIEEEAVILLARVGGDGPVGEIDLGLALRLGIGALDAAVEDVELRPSWRRASSCGRRRSRSRGRRSSQYRARRPCWRCRGTEGTVLAHVVGGVQPAQALVRGLQAAVVAGGHGDFGDAIGEAGQVDLHLRRLLLFGLLFVGLLVVGFLVLRLGGGGRVRGLFVGRLVYPSRRRAWCPAWYRVWFRRLRLVLLSPDSAHPAEETASAGPP